MAYVTGSKRSSGCVFCIPTQPDRAEEERRHIVYRGEHAFIILNVYPYNPGHLLIAPTGTRRTWRASRRRRVAR